MFFMQILSQNEFQRNKIMLGVIAREDGQTFQSAPATSGLPLFILPGPYKSPCQPQPLH